LITITGFHALFLFWVSTSLNNRCPNGFIFVLASGEGRYDFMGSPSRSNRKSY